jgi:AraC-like DNA-binding protein/DNA-binding transcriptional ArsR family regulator
MQLQVLTVLARTAIAPALKRLILEGRLNEAVKQAEVALRERAPSATGHDTDLLQTAYLCGDLMLALNRAEEAEETYRLAVKLSHHGDRGDVRVASCRSTGFLALHQQRLTVAVSCFARVASDEAAGRAQRVEALCALAVAHEGLGQQPAAMHALSEAAQLACETDEPDLVKLTGLVRIELITRKEIRTHDLLQDHVFWRSSLTGGSRVCEEAPPLAFIDMLLETEDSSSLVACRLRHLRDLLLATYGDTRLQPALMEHLARLRSAGLVKLETQGRIDTALVAIAQRQAEFARAVLKPTQGSCIEALYCQAKLSMLLGCADDAMVHYQRYAFESMERVRAGSAAAPRGEAKIPSAGAKDDIEMRLPAKYRRAYRYLQENLDHADLSVREISDSIGVTERAIQTAFKTHLGMTPGEVLQRCRVERIRAELLREDAHDTSVIETAARWGIRNRSTLLSSYRKYFSETPTQTLARRRFAAGAAA